MLARISKSVASLLVAALVVACASAPRVSTVTPSASRVGDPAAPVAKEDSADARGGPSDKDDDEEDDGDARDPSPCPANMMLVAPEGERERFCVDTYEAALVEIAPDGTEKPYPHWLPVDDHAVRAVSEPGVFPQGFISELQAEDACAASNKRLCTHVEWKTACRGPSNTTFPYGAERQPGTCHDDGKSAVAAVFGARAGSDPVAPSIALANDKNKKSRPAQALKGKAAETTRTRASAKAKANTKTKSKTSKRAKASARPASVSASVWAQLNDPRLGQVDGTLARTGSHEACVSGYGAYDMMGNLHEWVKTDSSRPHGTFAGGYYLDTSINGDGCQYRTTAHAHDYHDYSTGFRCCADPK